MQSGIAIHMLTSAKLYFLAVEPFSFHPILAIHFFNFSRLFWVLCMSSSRYLASLNLVQILWRTQVWTMIRYNAGRWNCGWTSQHHYWFSWLELLVLRCEKHLFSEHADAPLIWVGRSHHGCTMWGNNKCSTLTGSEGLQSDHPCRPFPIAFHSSFWASVLAANWSCNQPVLSFNVYIEVGRVYIEVIGK